MEVNKIINSLTSKEQKILFLTFGKATLGLLEVQSGIRISVYYFCLCDHVQVSCCV